MAATVASDVRQRSQPPAKSPTQGTQNRDEDASAGLKGLLSCIAGVGGVSIFIWLVFFVFLEPYDPKKAVCTRVGSMAELKGDLFEAVEVSSLDWKQLGKGLGLSSAQIGGLLTEGDGNMEDMLRMWYGDGKKACWETMIKALLRMGEKTSAEKLKEKYKVRVPSLQNTQPNKQA